MLTIRVPRFSHAEKAVALSIDQKDSESLTPEIIRCWHI